MARVSEGEICSYLNCGRSGIGGCGSCRWRWRAGWPGSPSTPPPLPHTSQQRARSSSPGTITGQWRNQDFFPLDWAGGCSFQKFFSPAPLLSIYRYCTVRPNIYVEGGGASKLFISVSMPYLDEGYWWRCSKYILLLNRLYRSCNYKNDALRIGVRPDPIKQNVSAWSGFYIN